MLKKLASKLLKHKKVNVKELVGITDKTPVIVEILREHENIVRRGYVSPVTARRIYEVRIAHSYRLRRLIHEAYEIFLSDKVRYRNGGFIGGFF